MTKNQSAKRPLFEVFFYYIESDYFFKNEAS